MLSADYIVGLTDGEGSFTVILRYPRKERRKYTKYHGVTLRYYIKMREDELPLLKKVKRFFRCGGIYFQKESRKNQRNCYRFEIGDFQKIWKVVIPFFRVHPLHSIARKHDFRLFCKIANLIEKKRGYHFTNDEMKKIQKLKWQMHK